MKFVMLEPLGIDKDKVMNFAKPLLDKGHELVFCGNRLDHDETLLRAASADVLIIANSTLGGDVIRAAKNLKMISVAFTGVDHVDADACREKGIIACNAQGYCTITVAELVMGLILNILRNIIPCNNLVRHGKTKDGFVGNELYGKTIGIIGTGAIGARLAELAKAFGCRL